MKTNARSGKSAFTLIEMLAVITIIVILASLVVAGMGYVTERQAKNKAQVQLALISKALDEYKLDMGQYPLTNDSADGTGQSADALYVALFYEGYDYNRQDPPPDKWVKKVGSVDVPKSTKIYLPDLDPTASKQNWVDPATGTPPATTKVKDPWGNEYRYRSGQSPAGIANPNTQNTADFDLWSAGKDGLTKPGTSGHKDNRDDIKNF